MLLDDRKPKGPINRSQNSSPTIRQSPSQPSVSNLIPSPHNAQHPFQQQHYPKQQKSLLDSPCMLILTFLLITCTWAAITLQQQFPLRHLHNFRKYFNSYLLNNSNRDLYEDGDNIDEPDQQIVMFTDMQDHIHTMLHAVQQWSMDGWTQYTRYDGELAVIMQIVYKNGQSAKLEFIAQDEAIAYIDSLQLRDFLLSLTWMTITVNFGQSTQLRHLSITAKYTLHSNLMLYIDLDYQYEEVEQKYKGWDFKWGEKGIQVILMLVYWYIYSQESQIKVQKQGESNFNGNGKLSLGLCALNLFSLLVSKLSAVFSITQLLLLLLRLMPAQQNQYSFFSHLFYSSPMILSIFIQIFIFLNGFVFYSMLMYPGDYFDTYLLGVFSYIYQIFQVGTYQVFLQLEDDGNLAHFLYLILYFYMIFIGNSLIPALFCILIQLKINEREIANHVTFLLKDSICPVCQQSQAHSNFTHIEVTSPKIKPLIVEGVIGQRQGGKVEIGSSQLEAEDDISDKVREKGKRLAIQLNHLITSIKNKDFLEQNHAKIERWLSQIFKASL